MDTKAFVIPILVCPNISQPINNAEVHIVRFRIIAVNGWPNVGCHSQSINIWSMISSSLLRNGQPPSISIPIYLSSPLVGNKFMMSFQTNNLIYSLIYGVLLMNLALVWGQMESL